MARVLARGWIFAGCPIEDWQHHDAEAGPARCALVFVSLFDLRQFKFYFIFFGYFIVAYFYGHPQSGAFDECGEDQALRADAARHFRLTRHRLDDMRVGVTDAGDVVVHIDVAAAVGIEQVDTLAADDVQWRVVEQRGAGPQGPVAAGGKCG